MCRCSPSLIIAHQENVAVASHESHELAVAAQAVGEEVSRAVVALAVRNLRRGVGWSRSETSYAA